MTGEGEEQQTADKRTNMKDTSIGLGAFTEPMEVLGHLEYMPMRALLRGWSDLRLLRDFKAWLVHCCSATSAARLLKATAEMEDFGRLHLYNYL